MTNSSSIEPFATGKTRVFEMTVWLAGDGRFARNSPQLTTDKSINNPRTYWVLLNFQKSKNYSQWNPQKRSSSNKTHRKTAKGIIQTKYLRSPQCWQRRWWRQRWQRWWRQWCNKVETVATTMVMTGWHQWDDNGATKDQNSGDNSDDDRVLVTGDDNTVTAAHSNELERPQWQRGTEWWQQYDSDNNGGNSGRQCHLTVVE